MSLLLLALTAAASVRADCSGAQPVYPPTQLIQGGMAYGRAAPGSEVSLNGEPLQLSARGDYVFGVARDAKFNQVLKIVPPCGPGGEYSIPVVERSFPVERVQGVPPKTANPPPAIAKRIEKEQADVAAARTRNDADRQDYLQAFIWPVRGRISGRFGSMRSYNGTPGSAHSGMDIAAPTGIVVKAPAAGIVTFVGESLYLTGGTVVLDHGQGISSNFLHLSRIDVKVGDRVSQSQTIGAVGATGRATGPHLHWGMNWLKVRLDPLLMLPTASD